MCVCVFVKSGIFSLLKNISFVLGVPKPKIVSLKVDDQDETGNQLKKNVYPHPPPHPRSRKLP